MTDQYYVEKHFNVYSKDWIYVDEFWSSDDNGLLSVGDYKLDSQSYDRPVYIKRMS